MDIEAVLSGTPYLMDPDTATSQRVGNLVQKSTQARTKALVASDRIAREAADVLGPYIAAARTDLVAESNVMEGMPWTATEAREVVQMYRELLDGPTRTLMESVRSDARVYQVLGLYRAHEIADTWASSERPPRAHEIRELHRLVLGDIRGSGEYKQFSNKISGTEPRTAAPIDVPRLIIEIADWWGDSSLDAASIDPILTATVVHAWLAHVHPFDDGNGRIARVIANLELARHGYPPLIVRPQSDRGEYYNALARSDEGDLLPLYALFVNSVARQAKLMSRPRYVLDLIEDQFLASERERYHWWQAALGNFSRAVDSECKKHRLRFEQQGSLSIESFTLLRDRDLEGNAWYAKVGLQDEPATWLLWFGYASDDLLQLTPTEEKPYPSIFVSVRDHSPNAIHPFTRDFNHGALRLTVPHEIAIRPGATPVHVRTRFDLQDQKSEAAAAKLVESLAEWTTH